MTSSILKTAFFCVVGGALISTECLACDVLLADTLQVVEVVDAVTWQLSDGRTVRLEGIAAPRPPAELGPAANWPIRERALAYARTMVEGKSIFFSFTEQTDRYDRLIGQAFFDDGTWINGALVSAGMARVETLHDQTRCASDAFDLEQQARNTARGIWDLSAYAVRSPEESAGFTNDFQIVEGVVVQTADVRGRVFLNFGEDYRTDFTITIAPADMRRFGEETYDPLALEGARIRVHGWLEFYNGPMIEVDHPEQIEVLE